MAKKIKAINIIGNGASIQDINMKDFADQVNMSTNTVRKYCEYIVFWDNPKWITEPVDAHGITIEPIINDHIRALFSDVTVYLNKGEMFDVSNKKQVPNVNLSGFLAISAAIHMGFNVINLYGFDGDVQPYAKYNKRFEMFSRIPGVKIYNMNPASEITCFLKPRVKRPVKKETDEQTDNV